MNRRLRSRHRRLMTLLAIGVPVALIAALLARPTMPVMERLPDLGGSSTDHGDTRVIAAENVSIDAALMRFELLLTSSAPLRYAVGISPQAGEAVRAADVLVYWTDAPPADAVPAGAQLLGTLGGTQSRRFALPAAARPGNGRLVFYSLGQQRLIEESWALPTGWPST